VTDSIQGLVPILATPFLPGGALDVASLRRLTEFQLNSQVNGVAVFGMASEGFALTVDERARILREVSQIVSGAVPIVAGVAATSTTTALEQAHAAEANGASALMILPPFMVKPNARQLVDFYVDIAADIETQVMVQDAPGATGVAMGLATVAELSKIHRVTSIKVEAPPTAPKIEAIAAIVDEEFVILGGANSQFLIEEYARGSSGTMPACEFSDLLAPIFAELECGRESAACESFIQLLPLLAFGVQPGIAWAVHKEILVHRGIIAHGTVRSPAADMVSGDRKALARLLQKLDLPEVKVAEAI
jgi:2-keto-3-deoxy-L-arabinonate dehydratase